MAPLTRFGLRLPTTVPAAGVPPLERLAALARAAEAGGFDSLWVADRPDDVLAPAGPRQALEAHTVLGALAVRTERALLGALVSPAVWRAPAILAKQVTTLDVLSAGRAVLGIGAGGATRPGGAPGLDPWEALEDALVICRAMFGEESATVAGHCSQVEGAANRPRPVRPGGPPILVGGNGERRTLPLAVARADGCNLVGEAAVLRQRAALVRRLCEAQGRDPATFTVTALASVVVGAPAQSAAEAAAPSSPAGHTAPVVRGEPDAVAAQLGALLDAGAGGIILDVPAGIEEDALVALGRSLVEAHGGRPTGP